MPNGKSLMMSMFAFLSIANADCLWYPIRIDTLGMDSFYVKTLSLDGAAVTGVDTISKSRFIDGLLKRFDSSNVAFIGSIDTVQRMNFNDGTSWRFKDSTKVKVDTLLKGQSFPEFWATEIDPTIECDAPGLPGVAQCAVLADDDYKSYRAIVGRKFILFADGLSNMRMTSVSPSYCRGDYGNYLVNDTVFSDYPGRYPILRIPLKDFLSLLSAHAETIYRPDKYASHRTLTSTCSAFANPDAKRFDLSGRLVYRSGGPKANAPNGRYLLESRSDKMGIVLKSVVRR